MEGDSDQMDSEATLPLLVLGCIVNRVCLEGDGDWIDSETGSPVLVSRYVVNGGCLEGDGDWIDSETALPVLVLGCVVNRSCFAVDTDVGGYTACGIPLVRSANGNGNGILFPFVSVKKIFESSVSVRFR